jgi:uracil-DNA glycosylase
MNPKDKIHESWNSILSILDSDEKLNCLNSQILPNVKYYPAKENIFNVFQMPVKDIKVVILGQDPYPQPGQAIGYAFAVSENTNKPASLRIIEKEVGSELDRTLSNWREQGVFLLNTALTVEHGKAGSHLKYWEDFIKGVITFISIQNPCIWVLWGAKAQAFTKHISTTHPQFVMDMYGSISDYENTNVILRAPHPAAEAYAGGKAGFYGCNHFNLVNEILQTTGKSTIVW